MWEYQQKYYLDRYDIHIRLQSKRIDINEDENRKKFLYLFFILINKSEAWTITTKRYEFIVTKTRNTAQFQYDVNAREGIDRREKKQLQRMYCGHKAKLMKNYPILEC